MPQIQERFCVCTPYFPASGIMLFLSFAFSVWLESLSECVCFSLWSYSRKNRERQKYVSLVLSGDWVSCMVVVRTGATLGNV